MHNSLILGSGRSGTSLLTGVLSKSGYFMGNNLYPGGPGNPYGFFESWDINSINEEIIWEITPKRTPILSRWFFKNRPLRQQLWLAKIKPGTPIPKPAGISERIQSLVAQTPYCFKDPRFSYTLNIWRPFLTDCKFVCVFRDPRKTAISILHEIENNETLIGLVYTIEDALKVWEYMYTHILEEHILNGDWLFIHYDQLMTEEGLKKVGKFLETPVDLSFPDASLKRSQATGKMSINLEKIYLELCHLANYKIDFE